jgi:hypothetical protein
MARAPKAERVMQRVAGLVGLSDAGERSPKTTFGEPRA